MAKKDHNYDPGIGAAAANKATDRQTKGWTKAAGTYI